MDRRTPAVVVLALAAAVTLSACDDGGSTAATREGGTTTTTAAARTSTTTTGRTGTPTLLLVPAGYPVAVPLPRRLDLASGTSTGDGRGFELVYQLGATSQGDAMDAFETQLDTGGFVVSKVPGSVASESHPSPLRADGHGWHVVARTDDTTLTLTVDPV